jgi:hypothetical protein
MEQDNEKKVFSALTVLIGITVLIVLILQYGKGQLNPTYFVLYSIFGIISVIHGIVAFVVDFGLKDSDPHSLIAQALFLYEDDNDLRPWSSFRVWISLSVFVAVAIVLFVSIASYNSSAYSVPNPYSWGISLNQETLAQHGGLENLFYVAIVPAIFEEWVVFAGIQALTFLILLLLSFWKPTQDIIEDGAATWPVVILVTVLVTGLYAWLFATAHGRYGGNEEALAYAWIFEFIVQMLNHLFGAFLSWIPHLLHNAAVVITDLQIVSFAAVSVVPNWLLRWKDE